MGDGHGSVGAGLAWAIKLNQVLDLAKQDQKGVRCANQFARHCTCANFWLHETNTKKGPTNRAPSRTRAQ